MRTPTWTAVYGVLNILAVSVTCLPQPQANLPRDVSTTPMVFAHYMIQFQPPNLDYTNDINLAKSAGIDAFAIDYGGVPSALPYFADYLNRFYKAAEKLDFKLFLCIDTTTMTDAAMVVNLTNYYSGSTAQMKDSAGNIFLSSFETGSPPWNWQTDVINRINTPVTFLPGTLSEDAEYTASQNKGYGPFTWVHPASSVAGESTTDEAYATQRDANGKPWMAGIAPWFFKRMSTDQNWFHAQDSGIWVDRWMNLLKLKPNFIEIVTWNDFGESSYIGPADSKPNSVLTQTTTADYYGNLDHTAFLKMTQFFVRAFKAGQTTVTISPSEEEVFLFYRLQPVNAMGSNSIYPDNSWPLPENASYIQDNAYIVPFLASPATVYLSSGGKPWQMDAPVGVSKGTVAFTVGDQILTASRNINGAVLNKKGPAIQGQLPRYQGNVVAL
ncbi:hypothetical protein N7G274_002989 [Stereocaulon virgatum]|uniref:Glycoside hydrolase family 71 protein n=1 Tax=Stereocaulon virgatum TaxID=373712 RepID=A0ABR4AHT9_9LECA